MDLRRVRIFCKIVEMKSFSRAAEAVHLAQPTVSEHMRLLEEELGEKLLERSGRSVEPTPAGKMFHPYARNLLRLSDEAAQALSSFRGTLAGKLQIGASTIPGAYLLPAQLQAFKAKHPQVQLSLKISSTAQTLSDLLDARLELALIGAASSHQQLQLTPLATDEMVLVVNPGHPWAVRQPIAVSSLKEHPFILREEGSGSRTTTAEALLGQGLRLSELQLVAEMGNSEAVRQSVKAGIGAAILSQRAVAEELRAGSLVQVEIDGLRISRDIYLARHQRRTLSPLADAFIQQLLRQDFH